MKKVIIFGAGRVSELVAHYISENGVDQVVAFTVDEAYKKQDTLMGLPVCSFETIQNTYSTSECEILVVVTFQGISNQYLLQEKMHEAKSKGYRLYTYIDRRASVDKTVECGKNVVICPHTIVEPFTKIGDGVIIRTGAYIGHDVEIGACSFIAPRASMSGFVKIEERVFVGNNATIRDRCTIGHDAVVGAGTTILENIPAGGIYKSDNCHHIPIKRESIDI